MKEKAGKCVKCARIVYCLEGFLDGVVSEDKELYCFSCIEVESED
ncbi:hypothetical protein NYQ66_12935 [Aquibacillus koreensis]|nr:hypothetical protein [Aquibacillus koreensis]MCT2536663.1 hypothetical protein [Aquibacillus koreensis]